MLNTFYTKPAYLLFLKLILITAASVVVSGLGLAALEGSGFRESYPQGYRVFSQVFCSLFNFVLPACLFWYFEGVGLKKGFGVYVPKWRVVVYVFVLVVVAMPVMQYLAQSSRLLTEVLFDNGFVDKIKNIQSMRDLSIEKIVGERSVINFFRALLMLGVLPAVCEELFFRGTLQRVIGRWTRNFHIAILITSVIFTSIHFDYYNFFSIFTASLILGYLYHYTRNILLVILFHFLSNGVNIAWMFFQPDQSQIYTVPLWFALCSAVVIIGIFKVVRHIIFLQHRTDN